MNLQTCSFPCSFFKTATSIFSTCLGCLADSTFNATNSLVIKSKPSYISPKPPPPIFFTTYKKMSSYLLQYYSIRF